MNVKALPPLTQLLLPIDTSKHSQRAVNFTGCLAGGLQDRIKNITLLHVMAGSYLSRHMANVDVRTEHILKSEQFQNLKEQHVKEDVMPFLASAESDLRKLGVQAKIDNLVVDGDPAEVIAETADKGEYSTIIMGRRGLSQTKEALLGSITSSLLHLPYHPTTYVAGERILDNKKCLLPRIMILVDGSSHSIAAVHEAVVLGSSYGNSLEKIILLLVIDLAHYTEETIYDDSERKNAEHILNQASRILTDGGIKAAKIETMAIYGRPVQTSIQVASEQEITLVMMGRRGRSVMKELLLGSVSSAILHRLVDPSLAIVCGDQHC